MKTLCMLSVSGGINIQTFLIIKKMSNGRRWRLLNCVLRISVNYLGVTLFGVVVNKSIHVFSAQLLK